MLADRNATKTAHPDSTAELIRSFQQGIDRESSFRCLFDRFYPAVFRFFSKRGLRAEDCRDLTQDTFLSVYRGLEGFRGSSRFETWLFQVAANIFSNVLRRRRALKRDVREVPLNGELESGHGITSHNAFGISHSAAGPFAQALANEQLGALHEALAKLPPRMRRCVSLRLDQDLKYRDIANLLKISEGAVKAQLHHARKRLKELLSAMFDDFSDLDTDEEDRDP